MGSDEKIVVEMRISCIHPVDLFLLPNTESLCLVKTPDSLEKSLTPQHFVKASDTATESIGTVKKCSVAIGDFDSQSQNFRCRTRSLNFSQHLDGTLCPNRPMPKQPANDSSLNSIKAKGRHQVCDDVVVVACIQCYVIASRSHDGTHHIECLITIKRCNLDRNYIFNLGKLSPE